MAQRLKDSDWVNIFRNLAEDDLEVEVTWLDSGDSSEGEWCLHFEDEMFEDGFASEQEALDRLYELEQRLLK